MGGTFDCGLESHLASRTVNETGTTTHKGLLSSAKGEMPLFPRTDSNTGEGDLVVQFGVRMIRPVRLPVQRDPCHPYPNCAPL